MEIKYNLTSSTAPSVKQRGLFRSVRYRVRCTSTANPVVYAPGERDTITAPHCAPSAYTTIRVKRTAPSHDESPLNRTSHDWTYMIPQEPPADRSDYLQTFNSMMESKVKARRNTFDWRKISRVNLPSLEQNEESRFCTLDPMPVTMDYIDELLKQSTEVLRKNTQDARQLTTELEQLRSKTQTTLNNIKEQSQRRMESIMTGVRTAGVNHIERKLEIRQQMSNLQSGMAEVKQLFDNCLERTQAVQMRVFNALPYELVENRELSTIVEPFEEKLF